MGGSLFFCNVFSCVICLSSIIIQQFHTMLNDNMVKKEKEKKLKRFTIGRGGVGVLKGEPPVHFFMLVF